jgi:hypothetical protein
MPALDHKTLGVTTPAPYGDLSHDDSIVLSASSARFTMNAPELEHLCRTLLDLRDARPDVPYLQVVRAWNECVGFMDATGGPETLTDVPAWIAAIEALPPGGAQEDGEYPGYRLSDADLTALIDFLRVAVTTGTQVVIEER